RYQTYQATAQRTPAAPKTTNVGRQPQRVTSRNASGADSMPPRREPRNIIPLARPPSRIGYHCEKLRATFGNASASPAPNRNRIVTRESRPRAAPVNIVNADHHNTI